MMNDFVIFFYQIQTMNIRIGEKKDLPQVLELVKELATYEKAPHEVINTVALMERDGFGTNPIYGLFVAENENGIVGISLYYWRYSTWKGKRLYLEDIIVTEKERGSGIGKLLFDRTMQKALEENCSGMMWQVLEWNEPAINFYKKYGAKLDDEWTNCTLEAEQIRRLLNKQGT
jgi:GNAT superfamily N-acetyltransferase